MLKHVPNALTILRLVLAPIVAWLFWMGTVGSGWAPHTPDAPGFEEAAIRYIETTTTFQTLAAILFVIAALTDFFDGMAARAFNAHSKFGRLIDPIADKAIVGLPLIAIALATAHDDGYPLKPIVMIAAVIIVIRDVSMTLIRLSAPDGEGAPVSSLAKVKTALELIVVGAFLIAAAAQVQIFSGAFEIGEDFYLGWLRGREIASLVWVALLVITAGLSAYTAWQYLKPGKKLAR